ncbi:SDR family NAD(P)-dependent oxidoreductase [Candidatus Woesearchaeota archaeon]|nr:SDR family NAD(P)-dependent oxidoreductase [Candidatus Woesearchaeota archaeon]
MITKNVLITGVSRGIGRALAEKFLMEGFFVIGTSTSGSSNIENKNLVVLQLDLSKPQSIKDCAINVESLNKKIDILINNAGVAFDIEDDRIDIDKLRKTLDINLIGLIDFTTKILPLINKGGHILNASSHAGSLSETDEDDDYFYPAYRISKAALNMYSRTLAIQLKDKITVSSFHPGWVKTDMGGMDADMMPEEAAEYIYNLAVSKVKSGQFWFKGKKLEW